MFSFAGQTGGMLETSPRSWWAVARSEEVTGMTPLAVQIRARPVVLWRDAAGVARALEDRCPHAGVRLSGGCVRRDGWLRCGAHGWSFEGATGALRDIPGMKAGQKVPAAYHAQVFGVAEGGGFVRVAIAPAGPPPAVVEDMGLHGVSHVALGHGQYVAALLDDPALLLGIRNVRFLPGLEREPEQEAGRIVLERRCRWRVPAGGRSGALTLVTGTDVETGETRLALRESGRVLLAAVIAPVPAARGVTAVRWRARLGAGFSSISALALRLPEPLRVFATVDADALRRLESDGSTLLGG